MNINDGMDAARFTSGNPEDQTQKKKAKKDQQDLPIPVLRDFNNK